MSLERPWTNGMTNKIDPVIVGRKLNCVTEISCIVIIRKMRQC